MHNIQMLLQEAGGELEDICKITIYITRSDGEAYRVVGNWLKGVFCLLGTGYRRWLDQNGLLKLDATAVIPD